MRIYKTHYAASVLYPLASILPKLALCLLYLRLFGVYVLARRISLGMIAILAVNAIAWLVPIIRGCDPVSAYWSPQWYNGRCLNSAIIGTWISLPNIVTDIVLLILPMPILWKTHISLPKKIGLMITFATGSIGIISACLRLGFYVDHIYVERPVLDFPKSKLAESACYLYIVVLRTNSDKNSYLSTPSSLCWNAACTSSRHAYHPFESYFSDFT